MTHLLRFAALAAFAALFTWIAAEPATAGCGCDHPPPAWTIVMPPFGSPGKELTIYAVDGAAFTPGEVYEVDFGDGLALAVMATSTAYLSVHVPDGLDPGPVALEVAGPGYAHLYQDSAFTALPPAEVIPDRDLVRLKKKWPTAIDADGTLLVPVDLSALLDPTQFALTVRNLPLAFEHDDVVIYNGDGVDLTLFTLNVVDPNERQWGSYYGWNVEEDTGLVGKVYDKKVRKALKKGIEGDIFTYWRHEFHSYRAAHEPGGSHEVNANGHHPDGSVHIDHNHIVLAIHGLRRDKGRPEDMTRATKLMPGRRDLDVVFASYRNENPIEPDMVQNEVEEELALIETEAATTP